MQGWAGVGAGGGQGETRGGYPKGGWSGKVTGLSQCVRESRPGLPHSSFLSQFARKLPPQANITCISFLSTPSPQGWPPNHCSILISTPQGPQGAPQPNPPLDQGYNPHHASGPVSPRLKTSQKHRTAVWTVGKF